MELPPIGDRKHFLVVIPVFQAVYPKPLNNFLNVFGAACTREHAKYVLSCFVPERTILHSAMNQCATLVCNPANGLDGMIFADDDCFPPHDAISMLLRHYEAGIDIVSGIGYMRGYPHTTTVGRYYKHGQTLSLDKETGNLRLAGFEWLDDIDAQPRTERGLVACDFSGFPITMVTRRAFEKIGAPWFGTHIDGGDVTHDVFFGHKAKGAGLQPYVDPKIDCGHLLDAQILTSANRAVFRQVNAAWRAAQKAEAEAAAPAATVPVDASKDRPRKAFISRLIGGFRE